MWVNRTIVVPSNQVELARRLCLTVAGPAGDGMFSTPLSETGEFPATHYISAGLIESKFTDLLPLDIVDSERTPGNTEAVMNILTSMNIEDISEQQVQMLMDEVKTYDAEPLSILEMLGLKLANEEME